ncbi:hypothetical protein [Hyphomonas sediminis]|uniref:hypothetical protein n=1 Tax=Hyphomonas sediminis TaxID=2866160 RepID=UPI001CEC4945|nr:hypothetical protein [Hyphomonas sediminis]
MRRIALILAATLLAATAVTGCRSNSRLAQSLDSTPNSGPCPVTGSVYDAARYVKFVDGTGELYSDIEFSGEITDVRLYCRYTEDHPLQAEIEIDFNFGKGLQARSDSHVYPYFVAVTRRNGKVLARETFATEAKFGGKKVAGKTELVNRITIPRADSSISGVNFEIVVGFDLDEKQLEFNRAGKRFRLDAGAKLAE